MVDECSSYISRTFFVQEEKVSVKIFRSTIILKILNSSQKYSSKIKLNRFRNTVVN